jgi:hypothetical protein
MPVNLSIKGVPDPIAAGLRARAAASYLKQLPPLS